MEIRGGRIVKAIERSACSSLLNEVIRELDFLRKGVIRSIMEILPDHYNGERVLFPPKHQRLKVLHCALQW